MRETFRRLSQSQITGKSLLDLIQYGVITAKMRCCIMLFYYDLLDSTIGVMSSLFGPFWAFLPTETVFPALSYTSTSEI